MHTENEEKEILYPNLFYCSFLKNWFKYSAINMADSVEGFHTRQQKIGEVLNMNYEDKPYLSVHLQDIVVAMMVSFLVSK